MKGNYVAEFLREIANFVECLDETELKAFIKNFPKPEKQSAKTNPKEIKKVINTERLKEILSSINRAESREIGMERLDQEKLNKRELTDLAKMQSIYIAKADNINRIKEKIIESTVGARLRSSAVRGDTLRK